MSNNEAEKFVDELVDRALGCTETAYSGNVNMLKCVIKETAIWITAIPDGYSYAQDKARQLIKACEGK